MEMLAQPGIRARQLRVKLYLLKLWPRYASNTFSIFLFTFSVTESKLRHFPILFSLWKSKYAEYHYLWLTHIVPDFVIHLDNCVFQEDSDVFILYFFRIDDFEFKSVCVGGNPKQPKGGYFSLARHTYFIIVKDEPRGITDFFIGLMTR